MSKTATTIERELRAALNDPRRKQRVIQAMGWDASERERAEREVA